MGPASTRIRNENWKAHLLGCPSDIALGSQLRSLWRVGGGSCVHCCVFVLNPSIRVPSVRVMRLCGIIKSQDIMFCNGTHKHTVCGSLAHPLTTCTECVFSLGVWMKHGQYFVIIWEIFNQGFIYTAKILFLLRISLYSVQISKHS